MKMDTDPSLSPCLFAPVVLPVKEGKSISKPKVNRSILRTPSLPKSKTVCNSSNSTGSRKRVRLSACSDLLSSSKKGRLNTSLESCSQITPLFLEKRAMNRRSKCFTKSLSLEALLDPDIEPIWCDEMATPPKDEFKSSDGIVPSQENTTDGSPKKGVARTLFKISSAEAAKDTISLLDDDCSILNSFIDETECEVPLSPAVVSCSRATISEQNESNENITLSPCIISKLDSHSKNINSNNSLCMKDSFLDASSVDASSISLTNTHSPSVISKFNPQTSLSLKENLQKDKDYSVSSGIGSLENSKIIDEKDKSKGQNDANDSLFFSPPILCATKKYVSCKITNDMKILSQSTPIVSITDIKQKYVKTKPVTTGSTKFDNKNIVSNEIQQPDSTTYIHPNKLKESCLYVDIPDMTSHLCDDDDELSPPILSNYNSMCTTTKNLSKDTNVSLTDAFESGSLDSLRDISASVLVDHVKENSTVEQSEKTHSNNTSTENTILLLKTTSSREVVFKKSDVKSADIDDPIFQKKYCEYDMKYDKTLDSKYFSYPKAKKRRKDQRILDNISIMTNKSNPDLIESDWFKSHLELSDQNMNPYNDKNDKTSVNLSPGNLKNNSKQNLITDKQVFIDMDDLTQIPSQELQETMDLSTKNSKLQMNDIENKKASNKTESALNYSSQTTTQDTTIDAVAKATFIEKDMLSKCGTDTDDISVDEILTRSTMMTVDMGFIGFQTGLGKKVEISEKSLKAAKKIFEYHEEAQSTTKLIDSGFSGFQTGLEKKIEIPEKSIKTAKKIFEDYEEVQSTSKQVGSGFSGFQTGLGKKVENSEKSLKAAKKMFEDHEEVQSTTKPVGSGFSGFQTGLGKIVEISEKSLKAAKKMFEDHEEVQSTTKPVDSGFSGFQTGSGKKVEISEKSIKAAKKMFENHEEVQSTTKPVDSGFSGFQTGLGKKVEISEMSIKAAKKMFEDHEEEQSTTKPVDSGFSGFQTGLGKKVEISEKSIKAAKKMFENHEEVQSTTKPVDSGFSGFQTGLGKKVEISEMSIKAAKKMFEDHEEEQSTTKPVGSGFSGFQTGLGKKVEISEMSIKAAKKMFEDHEEALSTTKPVGSGFSGFQTGLGKKVEISEKSLKAAKKMFEDHEEAQSTTKPTKPSLCDFQESVQDVKLNFKDNTSKKVEIKNYHKGKYEQVTPLSNNLNVRNSVLQTKDNDGNCSCLFSEGNNSNYKYTEKGTSQDVDVKNQPYRRLQRSTKSKKKIVYSSPAAYQYDRDVSFQVPLKSCYTSPDQTEKTEKSNESEKIEATQSTFITPFKPKKLNNSTKSENKTKAQQNTKERTYAFYPFGNGGALATETNKPDSTSNTKTKSVIRKDGRYYLSKRKTKQSFPEFVNYVVPQMMSKRELSEYDLCADVATVTYETSRLYCFDVKDHFSENIIKQGYACVGDGIMIRFSDDGNIGLTEFIQAFKSCEEVDEKLITDRWIKNHYQQIIWKLASYERRFPEQFARRCLTPSNVMFHMKYRYDKEIDHAERSCLKCIYERDDISSRRMVLCVCRTEVPTNNQDESNVKASTGPPQRIIELTDGWYTIKACLDQPLTQFVECGRIYVGVKLYIYGAELIGSENACSPLEAPESLMLRLNTNSTRRAAWDTKLGYQLHKIAFPVPLKSLYANGGTVGCIKLVVLRKYPVQYMEKLNGICIFRNSLDEEQTQKKYINEKEKRMETLYAKCQQEFENQHPQKGKRKRKMSTRPSDIKKLQSGRDIYDLLQNAADPSSIECLLSCSQREIASTYKQSLAELQQANLMEKVQMEWKLIEEEEFPERVSLQLQRYRVTDVDNSTERKDVMLTVWKPTHDIVNTWQEGAALSVYNLNTSASRYKQCSSKVQLSTTNQTRYHILEDVMETPYIPRTVHSIEELYNPLFTSVYNEIDVIGFVIKIERNNNNTAEQIIYLSDESKQFLAIRFYNGLQSFGLGDVIKHGMLVAFINLSWQRFHTPQKQRILQVTFTDLSSHTRNPKEKYLAEVFKTCSSSVVDKKSYLNDTTIKLNEHLRIGSRSVAMQPMMNNNDARCGYNINTSSTSRTPLATTSHNSTIPSDKQVMLGTSPANLTYGKTNRSWNEKSPQSLENVQNTTFIENTSENLPSEKLQSRHKLQIKKRLALERYREPPSLSPLPNNDVNVLKAKYRMPQGANTSS